MAIIDEIAANIAELKSLQTWRPLTMNDLPYQEQIEADRRKGERLAMAAYKKIENDAKTRRAELLAKARELLTPIIEEKRKIEAETMAAYSEYRTECSRIHTKPERLPGKGDLLDDLEACFRDRGGEW